VIFILRGGQDLNAPHGLVPIASVLESQR